MMSISSSVASILSGSSAILLTAGLALPRIGMFLLQWNGLDDQAEDIGPTCGTEELRFAPSRRGVHAVLMLSASTLTLIVSVGAAWSKDKPTRFWNLTGETVTHLSIAPAGTQSFGPDQCRNDRDGTVDFDERLPITDLGPGHYDVLLELKKGRRCRVKNVEIRQGEVFSIEEKDLGDCTP